MLWSKFSYIQIYKSCGEAVISYVMQHQSKHKINVAGLN